MMRRCLPVFKNITISMLRRIGTILLRPATERGLARRQAKQLAIRPPDVDLPLRGLSGGNQQKMALARWLAHLPRVLVLSEPTRGMDVGAKDDVMQIVRGLRSEGIGIPGLIFVAPGGSGITDWFAGAASQEAVIATSEAIIATS
jgi:ribose transport system ATP-binding protein